MKEIKPLTSLRGFAALAVVLQHFSVTAQQLTPQWIPSLVPHGYMAVHFFFFLSGYIMCLTYLPSFQSDGIRAFPGFLLKRIARIAPLNVFALTMLMVFGVTSQVLLGRNIFFDDTSLAFDLPVNMLMLQGLGIGTNLNGPSWSISTEFAAYFLFPVFILLVFNARRFVSVTAMVLALAALCSVAFQTARLGLGGMEVGDRLIETFSEFVLGMGSFILYRYRYNTGWGASDLELGGLIAAAAVGLVAGIDLPVALLCPFIVVATALNRGFFARILSGGIPYFLGLVSFSIYLIHDPFRSLGVLVFHAIHPEPTSAAVALIFALVGSLVVIPVSWLTYIAIERPGRQVVRRWAEMVTNRNPTATRLSTSDRVL